MSYTRSTLGPRGRGMGTTAIEYPTGSTWTPPPPPPPTKITVASATPTMARASRRAFGDISTDQAIQVVQSESGKPAVRTPTMPMWAWLAVGGLVAYHYYGGKRG